jgi:hypothetical protein
VGLRDRVERLEQREPASLGKRGYSDASPEIQRLTLERVLLLHENTRRERTGLPLLPEPEETEEELAHDRECLEYYRRLPTYQHGEGLRFIEYWEQSIKDKLEKGA